MNVYYRLVILYEDCFQTFQLDLVVVFYHYHCICIKVVTRHVDVVNILQVQLNCPSLHVVSQPLGQTLRGVSNILVVAKCTVFAMCAWVFVYNIGLLKFVLICSQVIFQYQWRCSRVPIIDQYLALSRIYKHILFITNLYWILSLPDDAWGYRWNVVSFVSIFIQHGIFW